MYDLVSEKYNPQKELLANGSEKRLSTDYSFLDKPIDREHGFTKRVISTIQRHWGGGHFPVVHITNDEVSWGKGSTLRSTGFVKSIATNGLRQNSSVGFIPRDEMQDQIDMRFTKRINVDTSHITEEVAKQNPLKLLEAVDRIRREFIHHGLRTNKNKVRGLFSIPAVLIFDGNIPLQQGDDRVQQAVTLSNITPEKLIGVFQFDPHRIIRSYIEGSGNTPSSITRRGKSVIHFREELSGNDPVTRKDFQRQLLNKIGISRLIEIHALAQVTNDADLKRRLTDSARDLIDIHLVSREDFESVFPDIEI